jgi:hypothetical protein
MTFQDRKNKARDWDKTRNKREELHDRDVVKANHPSVIEQKKNLKNQKKKRTTN